MGNKAGLVLPNWRPPAHASQPYLCVTDPRATGYGRSESVADRSPDPHRWHWALRLLFVESIYEECKMLWQDLSLIFIEHGNRDMHRVAHNLATLAIQSKHTCIWVDEPPSFILEALVNDVT